MLGYDKDAAFEYIKGHIKPTDHKAFEPSKIDSLIKLCIEADLDYMEESGVLNGGLTGDSFYDDDEAFEYIDERLCRLTGANEELSMHIASLIDDYMDLQQAFLEDQGLLSWE